MTKKLKKKPRTFNSLFWSHMFLSSMIDTTPFTVKAIFHWVACWYLLLDHNWSPVCYCLRFSVCRFRQRVHGGSDRSAEDDAHSFVAPYSPSDFFQRFVFTLPSFYIFPLDLWFWALFVITTCKPILIILYSFVKLKRNQIYIQLIHRYIAIWSSNCIYNISYY